MLLSSSSNGTNHSTGEIEVEGGECRRERMARKATLARFANVVPHILVMDPRSVSLFCHPSVLPVEYVSAQDRSIRSGEDF